jgi:hypothetical protein
MAPWGGWVVGSESSGSFNDADELIPVPAPPIPEPSTAIIALVASGLLVLRRGDTQRTG